MTTEYRIKEVDGRYFLQKRGWFGKWKNCRHAIPSAYPGASVTRMFDNYDDAIYHLTLLTRPALKPIVKYHYVNDNGEVITEDFDRQTRVKYTEV